jgi:hypothetical protein
VCLGAKPADSVGQIMRQDLPQPGDPLAFGLSPELIALRVRFQECLLNEIRGVELTLQARI